MSNESKEYMVICENLVKIYKTGETEVVALQGLDLEVRRGELMAIIGNSGSGKSTLMNMIGALDRASAGKLMVDNKDLFRLKEKELIEYKRKTVGFVWQNNARNLIPYLSALENVEMPMVVSGKKNKDRALELLEMVGLSQRRNSKLHQLSGGEQQRVAIAIALANEPKMLLADEPTGAVDSKTTSEIFKIFRQINQVLGTTILIVTHDMELSRNVDRVVAIRDGRTSSEFIRKKSYSEEIDELNSGEMMNDESHVEMAVIDKAGRIQIPKEYLNNMGIGGKDRVLVSMENKKIVLFRQDDEEDAV